MSENRKLVAILAADVVGYSRLASADDGRVIKRTGDGTLVKFRSVVDAVRCAVEVQNGMVWAPQGRCRAMTGVAYAAGSDARGSPIDRRRLRLR